MYPEKQTEAKSLYVIDLLRKCIFIAFKVIEELDEFFTLSNYAYSFHTIYYSHPIQCYIFKFD